MRAEDELRFLWDRGWRPEIARSGSQWVCVINGHPFSGARPQEAVSVAYARMCECIRAAERPVPKKG